ncbi:MAG: CopD family protein [Desulfobacterales bacterium]|nr:CopD family protein [Desulfobacterales bacterium]
MNLRKHRIWLLLVWGVLCWLSTPSAARATDTYARRTGKGCIFCHRESTGGQLRTAGFAYIRNGYRYPVSLSVLAKAESLQGPVHKTLRFIVGYLHLTAAVIFFGAIFYIHIFIRPTRLTGGLPKAERMLGLTCMAVLTATGAYLTWARIDRWEQFIDNGFGLMLTVKLCLFALMVAIGLAAVTVVHRKMRRAAGPVAATGDDGTLTPGALAAHDGIDGRPAHIAHDGRVYDVSASGRWTAGRHFGKHQAGNNLTDALAGAPHGAEVLEKIPCLGPLVPGVPARSHAPRIQRVFVWMAYTNLVLIFLILGCIAVWRWDFPIQLLPEQRAEVLVGQTCVTCHRQKSPAIVADWQNSAHGRLDVDCYKCHRANTDETILKSHLVHTPSPISSVVSPINCGGCHPREVEEFGRSKHANTHEIMQQIDYWLRDGMNNAVERTTGCFACHGTRVDVVDGKPVAGWPNVGIGRLNPDGSKGSCSSCHTRHRFSVEEARRPEACDQCHLGPDHPQIEIYNESKHGTLYHAEGDRWQFDPADRRWTAGRDFRAPTCAGCHMSAAGTAVPRSHDVTERLAWELQSPLTIHPSDFKPMPAATDWQKEREKMTTVCRQCHAQSWAVAHFANFDAAVALYNDTYYRPAKARMDGLYAAGTLSAERYFDEPLEWEFYELWHHEGRRARMGAAMMAPDYAWWHGFYELKHRFNRFFDEARDLEEQGPGPTWLNFPGRNQLPPQAKTP